MSSRPEKKSIFYGMFSKPKVFALSAAEGSPIACMILGLIPLIVYVGSLFMIGLAGDRFDGRGFYGSLLDRSTTEEFNEFKNPEPMFFFVLGGDDSSIKTEKEDHIVLISLTVGIAIWGVLDTVINIAYVMKSLKKIFGKEHIKKILLYLIILGYFICMINVLEFLGIFVSFDASVVFIYFWPAANLLRAIDVLVVTIFYPNPDTDPKPKTRPSYNCFFLWMDAFGASAGLRSRDNFLWEKILSFFVETVDTVFSFIYSLRISGVKFDVTFLNVLCIVKIVALWMKIMLNLKDYIYFGNYLLSVVVGAVMGMGAFITFFIAQLHSMHVGNLYMSSYGFIFTPLEVIIVVFALIVVCNMQFGNNNNVFPDDEDNRS